MEWASISLVGRGTGIRHKPIKINIIIAFVVSLSAAVLLYNAPGYLAYADKPTEADVLILFLGTGLEQRTNEAKAILEKGYTQYIIIPIKQEILGPIKILPKHFDFWIDDMPSINLQKEGYPYFYEKTHVEVLEAKRLMLQYGMKSAMFISSPYHMRRIKIITSIIFKNNSPLIRFIPTKDVMLCKNWIVCQWDHVCEIFSEYLKISFFMLYNALLSNENYARTNCV